MSDYASIMGGNAPTAMVGQIVEPGDVAQEWSAFYSIQSADVFLDRFDSSGDSVVDASGNASAARIELGSGDDYVFGGLGNDTIWAGGGNDVIKGGGHYSYGNPRQGNGLEASVAGGGDNTVSGAAGNDFIESGSGNDSLIGGEGLDTIFAGLGNDYVAGGSGADSIRGQGGDDSLFGGSGDDAIHGQDGNDMLVGGSGSDLLMGGAGSDSLFGGSGGDVFAFDHGFGQDVISDFGPGDRINLAAGLNGTGIASAADLVAKGMVSGGTTAAGTKFTVITIGGDTIRLERVDSAEFVDQISSWVKVG